MEILIRCLACRSTSSYGDRAKLPTEEEVQQLVQHNPGCPIGREDHRLLLHQEEVTTPHWIEAEVEGKLEKQREDRTKTVYTLLPFPAYQE